ncbi:MAG: hypothetical protein LBL83_11465 [Clostridiales bacterium]|nr:hypothetical protein [Clostridiales bacterium]
MRSLYPENVWEVSATLRYEDGFREYLGYDDDVGEKIPASVTILHITCALARCGEYWFPYDLCPRLSARRESRAKDSAKETIQ